MYMNKEHSLWRFFNPLDCKIPMLDKRQPESIASYLNHTKTNNIQYFACFWEYSKLFQV